MKKFTRLVSPPGTKIYSFAYFYRCAVSFLVKTVVFLVRISQVVLVPYIMYCLVSGFSFIKVVAGCLVFLIFMIYPGR